MGRLCETALVSLLIVSLLNTELTCAGKTSSRKTSLSNKGGSQSKTGSSSNRKTNPYPSGGSYPHPGTGNTNQGGYPRQNPAGSYPNQNPGRVNPGGYPNQNPAGGYPNQNPAGGYPNQNPAGGYPHQNPAGGYPNQNPAGGYPNQYPGRVNPGGYPNQNPAGGYPNQYPGRVNPGGYPNQNQNPGGAGYPNQYPAAGGYPNQYPGRGGINPGGYPYQNPAGGYPVRGGNTGQGWGVPGGVPAGGYPGGYPNWNPNNKILSPRYGGGGYGHGGYGMGGSPFSRSVQSMGYKPKSSGFAKKAVLAAGVGAVAGMAVGYGIGRFPRPHFSFHNPQEEYYYNNYMYRHYGSRSTDKQDYGRDYVYRPPPRAQPYDKYMESCMNRTDLLKDQGSTTPTNNTQSGGNEEDDDTVSIEEIGYPALIEQVKARRCVELYIEYSKSFLQKRKVKQVQNHSSPLRYGTIQLFSSLLMLMSSMLLLQ